MKSVAWHGVPELKQYTLERMRQHRAYDEFVQHVYWSQQNYRGCQIGCLVRRDSGGIHMATERLFGIPERLSIWFESIFDSLAFDKCAGWAVDSLDAIPVGGMLSTIPGHFDAVMEVERTKFLRARDWKTSLDEDDQFAQRAAVTLAPQIITTMRAAPVSDEVTITDEVIQELIDHSLVPPRFQRPVAGELVSPADSRGSSDVVRLDDAAALAGRI